MFAAFGTLAPMDSLREDLRVGWVEESPRRQLVLKPAKQATETRIVKVSDVSFP